MPGKGLVGRYDGSEILVGSPSLLHQFDLAAPAACYGGSVQTRVLVARDQRVLGAIALADELRAEAKDTVRELKHRGYRTILLTGDNSATAKAIGDTLGVHEAIGDFAAAPESRKNPRAASGRTQGGNGGRRRE